MRSDRKAKKYFEEGKIFPLRNTPTFEFWIVEGETGTHNVRYDKQKQEWFCDCKNVRLTPCCHIKSVLLYRNGKM